jgi:hypothetical protein
MANDTIASGGTFTLSQPLTGGTNIDFLNNAGATGVLNIKTSALEVSTISNGGTTTLVGEAIGGTIENFQPGDLITLQNLPSFYSALDFAPDAAAQNASFSSEATFAQEGGAEFFVLPNGSVVSSLGGVTLDANSVVIVDELRNALFGTAANNTTLTLALAARTNPNSNHPFIDGVLSAATAVNACFAAGTLILTVDGERAVESLAAGDHVITRSGADQKIIWVGSREIDISRHPRPETVQPIIIEPGALAEGIPSRRLVVSPDHALLIDDMLVQAKDITNRINIRQNTAAAKICYYHIELATHDIILADGAPAESFLDTGHRGIFQGSGEPLILHPDLMQARRDENNGAKLAAIRAGIAARLKLPAPAYAAPA